MRKIPSIFVRHERSSLVDLEKINKECEWVFEENESMFITVKRDGTPVRYKNGVWFQRRTCKSRLDPGQEPFIHPIDFEPCQPAPSYDDESKQWEWPGWVPLEQQYKKLVSEAVISRGEMKDEENGMTFELCGPKVNGNPEGCATHQLFVHASEMVLWAGAKVLTREKLEELISALKHEGVVIYSSRTIDGTMQCAKLKRRDLGLDWPLKA